MDDGGGGGGVRILTDYTSCSCSFLCLKHLKVHNCVIEIRFVTFT